MHICMVMGGTGTGGMERHVGDLANELSTRHEVSVLSHPIHAWRFEGRVRHLPMDLGSWRYSPVAICRLVRAIRRLKPDIVHAQHRKAGIMVSVAARFLEVPLVLTIHSMGRSERMVRTYDHVIGVSDLVTQTLDHTHTSTILNGIS